MQKKKNSDNENKLLISQNSSSWLAFMECRRHVWQKMCRRMCEPNKKNGEMWKQIWENLPSTQIS